MISVLFLLQAGEATPPAPVEENLIVEILSHSSWPALAIMAVVILLGLASIAFAFERWLYFRKADSESQSFAKEVQPLLSQGKLDEAAALAKKYKKGHLPRVVGQGIEAFMNGYNKGVDPVDLANRAIERESGSCGEEMRNWLPIMGTTGATSPFIGLLGTVVGIIVTFQEIKKKGAGDLSVVSGGISEALIATAIGLVVAIPAVMLFNYFSGKADKTVAALHNAGVEVIDTCRLHLLQSPNRERL